MTIPQHEPSSEAPSDRVEGDPAADEPTTPDDAHPQPAHPPFARTSEEYTDPPGHHRRPDGAATDVGA